VFPLIRVEPRHFPAEHTTHETLAPIPAVDSHLHPVEIRLHNWTIEHDWDLRNGLFRWGAGI
jgi:hypothetical protein